VTTINEEHSRAEEVTELALRIWRLVGQHAEQRNLSIPETLVALLMPVGNLVWSGGCRHCREECAARALSVLPDMLRSALASADERDGDKPPAGHVH
jgi:hypothetical protein